MTIDRYPCEVKDGALVLDREDFGDRVAELKDGPYSLTMKPAKNRSAEQNRMHFGLAIGMLSDHTGDSREFWHAYSKVRFYWISLVSELDIRKTFEELDNDIIMRLGARITTTKMNKKEFSEFFEVTRRWAVGEFGVVIPDPR